MGKEGSVRACYIFLCGDGLDVCLAGFGLKGVLRRTLPFNLFTERILLQKKRVIPQT